MRKCSRCGLMDAFMIAFGRRFYCLSCFLVHCRYNPLFKDVSREFWTYIEADIKEREGK